MTYRPFAPVMVGVTLILVSADVTGDDSLAVASRCCPPDHAKCCAETIEKRLPLNCSLSFEDLLAASNCIQQAVNGDESLKIIRIEDVECCQVFSDDFNDESEVCLSTCVRVLRSPSIGSIKKLELIRTCRPNNKIHACFRKCQAFRRTRKDPNRKFPYLAVCNLADRLKSGELYIGPELP
ncbi:hypothetical protein Q1695_003099 [Nippostrongylus brasiliensis]|nr:hypothetical protein Q1695_003099 [Nippostrongylus brasiliensis]